MRAWAGDFHAPWPERCEAFLWIHLNQIEARLRMSVRSYHIGGVVCKSSPSGYVLRFTAAVFISMLSALRNGTHDEPTDELKNRQSSREMEMCVGFFPGFELPFYGR